MPTASSWSSPGPENPLTTALRAIPSEFIEAFNGRLRAECLNAHWFMRLADAAEKLEDWRNYYNKV
jgi:transposase InsO family protein